MPPTVIVTGGGVIGCAAAYALAGAGCAVTLYERATIGAGATAAAAGILAPLAESAQPGPFFDLALAGLRAFQEDAAAVEAVSGIAIEYTPTGVLRPAYTAAQVDALQRSLRLAAAAGLPAVWLEPAEALRLEPGLAPALAGAMYSPEEAHVRPARLATALAQGAARRGAAIEEGVDVVPLQGKGTTGASVRRPDGTSHAADVVIVCQGAWSSPAFVPAGTGVRPVRGQYVVLRSAAQQIRRVVFGEECYAVPRRDGSIYLGATEEPDAGFRAAVTVSGAHGLLGAGMTMIPALARAEIVATGAGLRPATADRLPLLGRSSAAPGLVHASGHFRNGVLLSLITGRLLAELIVHGRTSIDLAPFAPDRVIATDGLPAEGLPAEGSGVQASEA